MPYLEDWHRRLPDTFRAFSAAFDEDENVSIAHGVLAAGVLWAVREDAASPALHDALKDIVAGRDVSPLLSLLDQLRETDPLEAARITTTAAASSPAVRSLLDQLVLEFVDEYLRLGVLQDPGISVGGNVVGGNVVIGGRQYIGGDLIVNRPRVWTCPTAPSPPAHFTGRRDELGQLIAAIGDGRSIAVTGVQGMGGIGKTALILKAAQELSGFGAVLWASLGPAPTVVNDLVGWARHADEDFEAGDSPLEVLAARVQAVLTQLVREHCPGRVLVILDDVWEGPSVAAARMLQRAAPAGATFVLTTRSQRVVAQMRSARLELGPLDPEDAVQLLRALLSAVPGLRDDDLMALAEAVGYHALALELAAGQVQLRERPETEINTLVEGYRGGIPAGSPFREIDLELGESRQDNLDVVLSYSYASLDESARAQFRALGVLAYGAPFDREVCGALWVADPEPGLDALRHRALLTIAPEIGWYQQHQLLRAYARALLRRAGEEHDAVVRRYCEHVVHVSARFAELPVGRWSSLEAQIPHVEEGGALLVAARGDASSADGTAGTALQFAANVRHLLARRRELRHAEWLEMGLAVARERLDLGHTSLFLNELAADDLFRGEQQSAIQRLYEASSISERVADTPRQAQTYVNLGTFFLSSDPEQAHPYFLKAVALFEELEDVPHTVRALVHLGQWHAVLSNPHYQRKAGERVLLRAVQVAERDADDEGLAEAKLHLGRLYDTLGRRIEALAVLEEAVAALERIGQRDLEPLGRLFLASAAAATGRSDYAEAQLRLAATAFRSSGHAPGQATALRNLAELAMGRRDYVEALQHLAEALPLVRLTTMEFLDRDYRDMEIAEPFFAAQYEDIVKLDLVEAFRARALGGLDRNGGEQDDRSRVRGWMPEDVLGYLVRTTRRACVHDGDRSAWRSALAAFAALLAESAPQLDHECAFAKAMLDLTDGVPAMVDDTGPYAPYVEYLRARVKQEQAGGHPAALDREALEMLTTNTVVARTVEPERASEWAIDLRRQRRNAQLWGDEDERSLFQALLAVLLGRPASVSPANAYRPALEAALNLLAQYEQLPLDVILEMAVAAAADPAKRADWFLWLAGAIEDATVHGTQSEWTFLLALAELVRGTPTGLAADHPFASALERARRAISGEISVKVRLPREQVRYYVTLVFAARTSEAKSMDVVHEAILGLRARAEWVEKWDEVAFLNALDAVLDGLDPRLASDNPYAGVLASLLEAIRQTPPTSSAASTLPEGHVDRLTSLAVTAGAAGSGDASAARDALHIDLARFKSRGPDWAAEAAFVEQLVALADGHGQVGAHGPYAPALERVAEQLRLHRGVRASGGTLEPAVLDQLLETTAQRVTTAQRLMEEHLDQGDFTGALQDPAVNAAIAAQKEWSLTMAEEHASLVSRGPDARAEAELFAALRAITDTQPLSLPAENPYFPAVSKMLSEIGWRPGLPDDMSVAALATDDKAAYTERFRGVLSGRTEFLEILDDVLAGTVGAMTIHPESAAGWADQLVRARTTLVEHGPAATDDVDREVELLDALLGLLRHEPLPLPSDHPYAMHLDGVRRGIAAYRVDEVAPGVLRGELIHHLWVMTSGVMSIAPEHREMFGEQVRQLRTEHQDDAMGAEIVAFLDALLIVLDGRPADLPVENRYRPYLYLILRQIRTMRTESASLS